MLCDKQEGVNEIELKSKLEYVFINVADYLFSQSKLVVNDM